MKAQAAPFTPSINFWMIPHAYKQVWSNKEWRDYILANGTWTMSCGESWDWKSKSLGGGIREVFLVKRH